MALNPFKKNKHAVQDQQFAAAPTIPAPAAPAPSVHGVPGPSAQAVAAPLEGQSAVAAVPPAPERKRRFRRNPNGASSIKKQRDQLAADFAKAQYDLGGLVYEMGLRKDYRTDVLDNRVEILQRLDGQLAESERVMRLDEAGAAGTCPSCGAMHARNAGFCWQCGGALAGGPPAPAAGATQSSEPSAPGQLGAGVQGAPPAPVAPQAPPVVPPPGSPQV